jgi:hypothetical protein
MDASLLKLPRGPMGWVIARAAPLEPNGINVPKWKCVCHPL